MADGQTATRCLVVDALLLCGGHWTVDSRRWTVDSGQWTVDSRQWTVIATPCILILTCLLQLLHGFIDGLINWINGLIGLLIDGFIYLYSNLSIYPGLSHAHSTRDKHDVRFVWRNVEAAVISPNLILC